MSFAASVPASSLSVAARYQLINELGRGGMGSVYRALDRLTGRVLTLKKLRLGEDVGHDVSASDGRIMLAQEFRLLASLRHPNIISVLDYGFDDDLQPYFTMDLEENADTIIGAGSHETLAVQVELFVQTLRAVAYLHRHGIIHCDLKPENILVVGDQVKVLDFGFSISRSRGDSEEHSWGGTLAYMAPELLNGSLPNEQSDLYALGVVAHELFSGGRPFPHHGLQRTSRPSVLPDDTDLDVRLRPVLERLLEPTPAKRYQHATDVIAALSTQLELPLSSETVATRESFLRTAPLIGRDREMAKLLDLLRSTIEGRGSAWLIGGESGVGKSRLIDEFAIHALTEPAFVVRGQALSQGGGPYHAWREVISNLILRIELTDFEAGVLKPIVNNIAGLLGREVSDAPPLDPEAMQSRLLITVEEVVRRQPRPIVVLLEDLQWAGSESLGLWNWLARLAGNLRLLLLGSYRNDETPRFADLLDSTEVLPLARLGKAEIADLGELLIGAPARKPELLALLERETEGIPFFIVEVVRNLAERAGELSRIADLELPHRVASGGMQKLVRGHLRRVDPRDMPPLKLAAVIGRDVEPRLMLSVCPEIALEAWSERLAAAAVFEARDQQWRFAHDKLREQLLADLTDSDRQALHRRVAEAIEATYPGSSDHITALAHHWKQARDAKKEDVYVRQAGFLALQSGACWEAIAYFDRAITLVSARSSPATGSAAQSRSHGLLRSRSRLDPNKMVDPNGIEFLLGSLEGGLTEAYYRLGDLKRCRHHGELALTHLGQYVPKTKLAWVGDTVLEAAVRCVQAGRRVRSRDTIRAQLVAREVGRVLQRLTESFYFSLQPVPVVWSSVRMVNQCAPAGPSPSLAQGYVMLAILASAIPAPALAMRWCREALRVAEETASDRDVALILSRSAVVHKAICRWDEAKDVIDRAAKIAEHVGDMRLWAECAGQRGLIEFYSGNFDSSLKNWEEAFRLARRSGNQQVENWGLAGQGDALLRLGRYEEAGRMYQEALDRMKDQESFRAESICLLGMYALMHLRAGDEKAALAHAEAALVQILTNQPIVYFVQQGFAATAEVFLRLAERQVRRGDSTGSLVDVRAGKALASLRRFARRFPLGRPHANLWQGVAQWLRGQPKQAMRSWERAIDLAERLHTPYELGQAHLEIGRHLPSGEERDRHLHRALSVLEKTGASTDLQHVLVELEGSHPE